MKVIDRTAGAVIRVFGVLVIAVVALIFVFIVREIVPLFAPATSAVRRVASAAPLSRGRELLGIDEFESLVYLVRADGTVELRAVADWEHPRFLALDLLGGRRVTAAYRVPARDLLFIGTADGRVLVAQAVFEATFDPVTSARTITPSVAQLALVELPFRGPVVRIFGRGAPGRSTAFVAEGPGGEIVTATLEPRAFEQARERGGVLAATEDADAPYGVRTLAASLDGRVAAFALDAEASQLFVATEAGSLHHWYLQDDRDRPFAVYPSAGRMAGDLGLEPAAAPATRRVTALELLIGDASLVVG
ncbi:MAG TPA: hypothetical protein VH880_05595, partial [Anaeromyxobacteraceae bacterium]